MIFKTLTLDNIRSYHWDEIKFPVGTSLFEGDIGSGKSTLLMAIEFALFGLGNQKGDSLLRKGTKKGSVMLEFEIGNDRYLVKRSLIRKEKDGPVRQDKGILGKNGSKIHLSPSEIKEKILKILHFKEPTNPKAQSVIFRYAIYTPQEDMKYVLSQRPDERLQILRKAFGIEDYKIAAQNAALLNRVIRDKTIELETKTADLDDRKNELFLLKGQLEISHNLLKKSRSRKKELKEVVDEQKEGLEKLQKLELELNKVYGEIPHLIKQIQDKKELIRRNQEEIEDTLEDNENKYLPQIEKLEETTKPTDEGEENLKNKIKIIKKMVTQHGKLSSNLTLLNKNREDLENELGTEKNKTPQRLKKENDDLKLKIKEQSILIKADQEQLQKITQKIYKLELEKSDIEDKLNNVDGLGDLCPICGSVLNDEHIKNLKSEGEERIRKIDSESKVLGQVQLKGQDKLESEENNFKNLEDGLINLKSLTEKINRLEKIKKDMDKINIGLKELDENLKSLLPPSVEFKKMDDYLNHFEGIYHDLQEYNRGQIDLENLRDLYKKNENKIKANKESINVLNQEIGSLGKDLKEYEKKRDDLKNIPSEIAQAKLKHEKTAEELQSAQEKMVETKTLMEKIKEDISRVEDEVGKKEALSKQLNRVHDYHIWINDYLIPTLSLIEKHVLHKRYEEFNLDFQKWFSILIEDPSKTAKIDEEFTPIVEQDGFEQDISYLSGGEKTSIALAYRLALNNIVQKVSVGMESNILILDEPTDGFSREQLYKVREVLNELECPQIIMVSHERELGSFADNVFRVDKIDGTSTVKLIG